MWDGLLTHLRSPEVAFSDTTLKILASHETCRRLGLAPNLERIADNLPEHDIERLLKNQCVLMAAARRLYLDIGPYLTDPCTTFVITDNSARVLCLQSAPEVIFRMADIGLRPGASLSEDSCGSNAVALAIQYLRPITLRSTEHYCNLFHEWSCSAAPLFDQKGALTGCIQLCSDAKLPTGEGLALATLLAKLLQANENPTGMTNSSTVVEIDLSQLSPKQRAIVELLMVGKTYKQIANTLCLSTRTIESHVEKLKSRYKARTTAHLIALVINGQRHCGFPVSGHDYSLDRMSID